MKAVVAAFNQEKALVGAFSVITNLRMQFGCNFLKHYAEDNTLDAGSVTVSGPTPLPAPGLQRRRRGNYRHVQLVARGY